MTTPSRKSASSLLLIGDLEGALERSLRLHVAAAADWHVQSWPSADTAVILAPNEMPNLAVVVCEQGDALECVDLIRLLEHAKRHWPYTFFVAVSTGPLRNLDALFERFGDMPVVDRAATSHLFDTIEREMGHSAYGLVRGVSLPSFLQIMAWEHKSLCIRVEARSTWGRLHVLKGRLVEAYSDASRQEGEPAALDILSWETVSLQIERSYHNGRGGGMRDVQHLLMDAMKKKDEDAKQESAALAVDLLLDDEFEEAREPGSGPRSTGGDGTAPTTLLREMDSGRAGTWDLLAPEQGEAHFGRPVSNVRETLASAMSQIDGAVCAALVDYHIGMALETEGGGLDFDLAAAGYTDTVRAGLRTMESLGLDGDIEDILITLRDQYHILSVVPGQPLFLHLVLRRDQANPARARSLLKALGHYLVIA